MTYEQILKEFDEKFTYLGRNQIDQQEIILKPYTTPEDIKSFLKQSFIKYLEEQLEITKRQQADLFTETEDFLDGFALCKSKTINRLQAQITKLQ